MKVSQVLLGPQPTKVRGELRGSHVLGGGGGDGGPQPAKVRGELRGSHVLGDGGGKFWPHVQADMVKEKLGDSVIHHEAKQNAGRSWSEISESADEVAKELKPLRTEDMFDEGGSFRRKKVENLTEGQKETSFQGTEPPYKTKENKGNTESMHINPNGDQHGAIIKDRTMAELSKHLPDTALHSNNNNITAKISKNMKDEDKLKSSQIRAAVEGKVGTRFRKKEEGIILEETPVLTPLRTQEKQAKDSFRTGEEVRSLRAEEQKKRAKVANQDISNKKEKGQLTVKPENGKHHKTIGEDHKHDRKAERDRMKDMKIVDENMKHKTFDTKTSDEEDQLEPLRTTHEENEAASEEVNSLQAFRAVEQKLDPRTKQKEEMEERKYKVASIFAETFKNLSKHGMQVSQNMPEHKKKTPGCSENEIFFLNKDKMFLVSSEQIVHDITGLADFENNLWSQINNQDHIIQTLRERLRTAEKHSRNINLIVETMRSNDNTHKVELKETKNLLDFSMNKIKHLESVVENQIAGVEAAKKETLMLKLKMQQKDVEMNSLRNRLEHGKEAEHSKFLKEELDMCLKEKESEKKARKQLEVNLEHLNTTFMMLRQTKVETGEDVRLMERELREESWQISLLKEELTNHRRNIDDMNSIVLEKDTIVQGLQDQVISFMDHDSNLLEGCIEKDKQIEAQYQAMSNLRNLTGMQDMLTRAKEMALKILQNTVFEMVDKIPQCRDTAIKGLRKEIENLNKQRQPLESIVKKVKAALQATREVLKFKNGEVDYPAYQKLIASQKNMLHLCQQETKSQHRELNIKLAKFDEELSQHQNPSASCNCQSFCRKRPHENQLPERQEVIKSPQKGLGKKDRHREMALKNLQQTTLLQQSALHSFLLSSSQS